MSAGWLVGIDVGTSSCKATVLDLDGVELAIGRHATPWRFGAAMELGAEELLDAVGAAVQTALRSAPGNGVVLGVGVASMAEAGYLIDPSGRPSPTAIGWQDDRASVEVDALTRDLPAFTERTGLRPGPKPTAVKHRWSAKELPDTARASVWLNVAEYVVHALGGDRVAEPSLASRTGWLELDTCRWWDEALAWSGAHARMLPELRAAGMPAGTVGDLRGCESAVLTVAGHDHLCAAVGAGARLDGDVTNSCGTAEVLLRAVPPGLASTRWRRAAELGLSRGWHVVDGRQALLGGFLSGHRMRSLASRLGLSGPAAASKVAADAGRVEPPPAVDLDELDRFLAEDDVQAPEDADVARWWAAAADAIARAGAKVLAALDEVSGAPQRLLAVGGTAQEAALAEARRRHLGPAVYPPVREAAARGAALAAGVAAGIYEDLDTVPTPCRSPMPRHSAATPEFRP